MTERKLKQFLTVIKNNEFELAEGINPDEITDEMLKYIGSIDPELRDNLIYVTFYNWVLGDGYTYSDEKLNEIAMIAIDDQHLLYKLGEKDTDSVFTRTFSALLCALVLHADRERQYLSEGQFHQIKEALFQYLKEERDIRGFVPVKGWAHGVAHAADAIEELPHFGYMTEEDLHKILDIIRTKMVSNEDAYICLEDERMTNPVVTMLKRKVLPESEICAWLDSFNKIEKDFDWAEDRFGIHNLKLFLKSLYFKVIQEETLQDPLAAKIQEVILKTR